MRDRRPTASTGTGALATDERGTTTTLSYVLTLAITAALVSGILIAAGASVEDRRETVARDELEVIGQQLGSRLLSADRLVETGADEVEVTASFPRSVAGSRYRIEVIDGSPATLRLEATGPGVTAEVSVPVRTDLVETSLQGGDVSIVLTDAGSLEVRHR